MNILKYVLILIGLLLFSNFTITSCSDSTLELETAGRWSYSFPSGLEATGFDYDPEGGLVDAINIVSTTANGKNYLVLSFDPMSGPGKNSRLFIFDTEDPLSPQLISSIAHPDQERKSYLVRSAAVYNGVLYAGLFGDKGLWMVDISDPIEPEDLGISTVELNNNIIVSGDYAYASGQMYDGVIICDISDTLNVSEIARISLPTRECRLAVSSGLLFIGTGHTLTVYDVSTPSSPKQLGTCELEVSEVLVTELPFPEPGKIHSANWANIIDMQASGDYVYVTFGAGQIRIIDVSDPSAPKEIAEVDLGGFAIALTVEDNFLYVTKSDAESQLLRLDIIDISEPGNPKVIDSIATESMFGFGGASLAYMWARPQVIGDYIYVGGINYFDIFMLK